MNKEEHNSDANYDYDEELFDNDTSDEISNDGEIHSEVSSVEELLENNEKIVNAIHNNQSYDENSDSHSDSSEQSEVTNDMNSTDLNPAHQSNSSKKIPPAMKKKFATKSNEHEIDESDSEDDLALDGLSKDTKLLSMQSSMQSSINLENDLDNEVSNATDSTRNGKTEDEYNDGTETSSCRCHHRSEIVLKVTSHTPTSFNPDNIGFFMDYRKKPTSSGTSIHKQRNSHRKSLSFSNERMREIERHNQILLRKILNQKPSKECLKQKAQVPAVRTTTSAVNRKKQQRQIDLDNQLLKRKIESIALRRPKFP